MPRASRGSKSGSFGFPLPFENRTCARTGPSRKCAARVKCAASVVGVNVAAHNVPLAWAARNPGWWPLIASMASTACRASSSVAIVVFLLLTVPHLG